MIDFRLAENSLETCSLFSDRNPIGSISNQEYGHKFPGHIQLEFFVEGVKRNHFKGSLEINCPYPMGSWRKFPIGF